MSPSREIVQPPVPERNGWRLYAWPKFAEQFTALIAEVEELKRVDPTGYDSHPKAKLLFAVLHLIRDVIPADPGADAFRQGNTLGSAHRHWFRAKFYQRFRIFFRFHSSYRVIVYAWMNDEATLRKRGARTDVYHVFQSMLERGAPPSDFDALLEQSHPLKVPPTSHGSDSG